VNYIEVTIDLTEPEHWKDIFIAQLAEKGFESFVETKSGILGYIQETLFLPEMIDDIITHSSVLNYQTKSIEEQNWNAQWEKNFDPVFIDDKLAIIAPFHTIPNGYNKVITIMPKMSFGTGHHQTTWLVARLMFDLDLKNKTVLDMGTGTGVLAILAEKLGANSVTAIDIDQWSYENALENIETNNSKNIHVVLGDHDILPQNFFHIIIANINKNILLSHLSVYSSSLLPNGTLILSGFFETDKSDIISEAEKHGFIFEQLQTKEGWATIQLNKK